MELNNEDDRSIDRPNRALFWQRPDVNCDPLCRKVEGLGSSPELPGDDLSLSNGMTAMVEREPTLPHSLSSTTSNAAGGYSHRHRDA